jgi:proteic killer suppression protein
MAIKSFKHKSLEELFVKGSTAKIGKQHHRKARRILDHLNGIADLNDCRGVCDFHELKGNRKGTCSMHVSGNYCITFQFARDYVTGIDFEDYH